MIHVLLDFIIKALLLAAAFVSTMILVLAIYTTVHTILSLFFRRR